MRMNAFSADEMDGFVRSISGKALSTRNIETLAHAYFKGLPEMRQQIKNGNTDWALERLKQTHPDLPDCSSMEQTLLQDLTLMKKYMLRIIANNSNEDDRSNSFYAQCNLLTRGILKNMDSFSKTVKDFYDRSGHA